MKVHGKNERRVQSGIEARLRVVCAVPYPLRCAPSQRFRWEQWAPLLSERGVEVDFVSFSDEAIHDARGAGDGLNAIRLSLLRYPTWSRELYRARRANLLIVHRNAALAGPPVMELLLHRLGHRFVYDFDDAIYLPPVSGDNLVRRLARADWRVGVLCPRAALVSVGNRFLADHVAQYTDQIEIWPTTIAMSEYTPRELPPVDATPVIGWSGSQSTAPFVQSMIPLLKRLRDRHAFELLIVGAEIDLQGLEGECVPWSAESEVPLLHRMDIGLMPLPDNPWTRGKCACKALMYLGVETAAVVSDVGVNRDAVPDGRCGFVVQDDEEWLARLGTLLEDRDLRIRMGKAGRVHVAQNYSAEVWAPRIASSLRAVATSG
jgi:glycosyltransferase involved in cell wall biosynthesis